MKGLGLRVRTVRPLLHPVSTAGNSVQTLKFLVEDNVRGGSGQGRRSPDVGSEGNACGRFVVGMRRVQGSGFRV